MEDLKILPLVVFGVGALMIWGGLTGQSPVQKIKGVLTQGNTQSADAKTTATSQPVTGTVATTQTYTVSSDYLL